MSTSAYLKKFLTASAAIVAITVQPTAAAFAAEGTRIPDNVVVDRTLADAFAKGDFAAKITPRQGYVGKLLFGNLAKHPGVKVPGAAPARALVPGQHDFYPADLGYYGYGYLPSTQYINVYWGEANSSTWGYPDTYEWYLQRSSMIHTLDQYVGSTANDRYGYASHYWYGGGPGSYITQSGIASTVQYWATQDRAAWGAPLNGSDIYHVFLPPGTDTCFDNLSACYNPDGKAPGPFGFCGYHSYTTLSDGTIVLYTVEPYQSVSGCSTGAGTSNDTANVLGHEIAETITDPIVGGGWVGEWVLNNGQEVGDECAWTLFNHTLYKATYYTQDWYENSHHACGDTK
jgi:hypothetical protein